jgi:PAS domain S-box-containing protein
MITKTLELIDFEKIDILLEGFNRTTGFVTAILDLEGNVLSKSGWRRICTDFHRVNKVTAKRCTVSDTVLAGEMKKGEVYHFYKCLNGLVDVAVPLVINGEHVANLFSGQFFFEKPDLTYFKKQARKFGFDEESYLDALSSVPVIPQDKVKTAMDFLRDMTQLISDLAYQKGALNTLNINIRESEELFKTVFETANVGKSVTLPTGEINVNETFCKMLGYSKGELKNKKWQDITPIEEIPAVQEKLSLILNGEKENARFEKRYICKDGSFIWADVNVSLCRDIEQKPKFFITTVIDITDRKKIEKELSSNEEKYRSFFMNSFDAILLTSPDGTIQAANPAACAMFGKTEEEITREGRDGLVDATDPRLPLLLADRKKEGKAKGVLTFKKSDNSCFQAEVSSALFTDSQGMMRTIMIISDITERLESEEAVRISEEKYLKIFQASPDLIILTSLDEGIIVDVNERLETMTGYSREEIIGKKTLELDFWAEPAQRDMYVAALQQKGKVRDFETKFRIKSGELRDALLSGEIINLRTGRIILGVIRDITEQKRAEEQKRLSEEMFRGAFHNGPASMTITRISDGKFIDVNESFLNLFGFGRSEVLGRTSTELKMWSREERDRLIARQIETGGLRNFELVAFTRDAKPVNVLFSSSPITLNEEACLVTTMIDITERKKVEAEKNKFVMLADSSSEFIGMCDLDMNPIYVNPAGIKMVGLADMREACSVKVQDYFFPEDQPFIRDEFFPTVLREGHGDVEIRLRHFKTGQPIWMYYYLFHVHDSNGSLIGWATVSRDISERRKFLESISESEERLRLSTEMANVAVWEYNFITNSMSRSLNHDKLYGLEWQAHWDMNTFLHAIHPEDREFSERIIQKSVSPGGPDNYRFEFRVIYPDNSVHWLDVAGKVVSRNDIGIGMIVRGALIDITHLKKIQEQLFSSERKFETLFRSAAMPVVLTGLPDNIIVDVNDSWIKMMGYRREEVIGIRFNDLKYRGMPDSFEKSSEIHPLNIYPSEGEITLLTKSGTPVEVIINTNIVEIDQQKYALTSIYNITERKTAERKLSKQTRLYAVLSRINELLVREKNTERLYYEVCKIIVNYGGFRMAWIGLLGGDNKRVAPVSFYGHEEGYLKIKLFSGNPDVEAGTGPTGKTIRSGSYHVCNDIAHDNVMLPWRDEALKRGYRSSISVALRSGGEIIGTINIYSETTDFFDNSEIRLVNTLAENISYALDSIEFEKQNRANKQALLESRNHYETIFEHSVVPVWEEDFSAVKSYFDILRSNGVEDFNEYFTNNPAEVMHCASLIKIVDINQTSVRFFGQNNKSEVILTLTDYFFEDSLPALAGEFSALADRKLTFEGIIPLKFHDGTKKHLFLQLRVVPGHYETLKRVLISWIDISERISYEEELKRSREELRNLARHIETVRENERKSIAMNLHDDLGQKLTAIKMDLNRFKLRTFNSDAEMENRINGMLELIDDTVKTVQRMSSDLRPAILYDLGLKEAIEWQIREFTRSTGIHCHVTINPEEFVLAEDFSVAIFRIIQEGLTNIARHSSATEVRLSLSISERIIELLLKDNGKGISAEQLKSHTSFGLISMRERTEALSGKIEITGIKEKGTELKIEIPVKSGKDSI